VAHEYLGHILLGDGYCARVLSQPAVAGFAAVVDPIERLPGGGPARLGGLLFLLFL
jgi:hypothetical protein